MSKNGRILVVEDDFDIADMLRIFFVGQESVSYTHLTLPTICSV